LEGALTGAGVVLTGTGTGAADLIGAGAAEDLTGTGAGWDSGAGTEGCAGAADDFASPPRLTTEAEATEAERIRAAILEKCMSVEMDRRLDRED
jgi:hypothetical protein